MILLRRAIVSLAIVLLAFWLLLQFLPAALPFLITLWLLTFVGGLISLRGRW